MQYVSPAEGVQHPSPRAGVVQSAGQVQKVSAVLQTLSPQEGTQSAGQPSLFSVSEQQPSPHCTKQSLGQVHMVSPPAVSHTVSPHPGRQSSGQFCTVSPRATEQSVSPQIAVVQSLGQAVGVSEALQLPSPHWAGQSSGLRRLSSPSEQHPSCGTFEHSRSQLQAVSLESQVPLPHVSVQSSGQLAGTTSRQHPSPHVPSCPGASIEQSPVPSGPDPPAPAPLAASPLLVDWPAPAPAWPELPALEPPAPWAAAPASCPPLEPLLAPPPDEEEAPNVASPIFVRLLHPMTVSKAAVSDGTRTDWLPRRRRTG